MMDRHLQRKSLLIMLHRGMRDQTLASCDVWKEFSAWPALNDFPDGYDKANAINYCLHWFSEEEISLAYGGALAMRSPYGERALANVYPRLGMAEKKQVLACLSTRLQQGEDEATYQLKRLVPLLDVETRSAVANMYVNLSDFSFAYFVIRNDQHLDRSSACAMISRAKRIESNYLKIRSLLKLSAFLPAAEIEDMYRQFMDKLETSLPCSESLHNFYQFSAVLTGMEKNTAVGMALDLIARFDDRQAEYYDQQKYYHLSFLTPHLDQIHRTQAYSIASTVRRGYRSSLLKRLQRHFSGEPDAVYPRPTPLCY